MHGTIVRLAAEAVIRLREGTELENFMTTHHAYVCSYNLLSLRRVFGPLQAAHPSPGGQEGIFPALEPRSVSQQGLCRFPEEDSPAVHQTPKRPGSHISIIQDQIFHCC